MASKVALLTTHPIACMCGCAVKLCRLCACEAQTTYRPGSVGSEGSLGLQKISGNLGLQLGLSGGLCRGRALKAQRFTAFK